jgi:hypothetical protein
MKVLLQKKPLTRLYECGIIAVANDPQHPPNLAQSQPAGALRHKKANHWFFQINTL